MKTNPFVLTFACLSTLGSLSCGPDKTNEPATVIVPDSWTLSRPILLREDEVFETSAGRDLVKNPADPIAADSRIAFASLKTDLESKTDVSISFKMNCLTGGKTSTETHEFHDQWQFQIRTLLPLEFLENPAREAGATIVCSMKVIARSSIGSTHEFTVSNLVVQNFEHLENLAIESMPPAPHTKPRFVTGSSNVFPSLKATDPTELRAKLICDHFRNERKIERSTDLPTILKELLDGKQEPKAISDTAVPDARKVYVQQSCRLLMEGYENDSAKYTGPFRWLSPVFTARFPTSSLDIRGQWDLKEASEATFKTQVLFRTFIRNTGPIPVGIKVPILGAKSIALRHVSKLVKDSSIHISRPFTFDMTTEFKGAPAVSRHGNDKIHELMPGEKLEVIGRLNAPDFMCHSMRGPMKGRFDAGFLIGFKFHFNQPFRIERFLNWDSKRSLTGPTIDITPGEILTTEKWGWVPHVEWETAAEARSSPTGIEYEKDGYPIYCFYRDPATPNASSVW